MSTGSRSCVPAVVTRTANKDHPPNPQFIVSVARWLGLSRVRSFTVLSGLQVSVESYVAPKGHIQCKRCRRFGHTQQNCGYAPRCVACGGSHLSVGCSTTREQPQCCGFGGNHTANYRDCVKWKEARAAFGKKAPKRPHKYAATGHPAAPIAQQAGPSAQQLALGERWSHVVPGGVLPRLLPPLHPLIQIPLLSLSRRCPGLK